MKTKPVLPRITLCAAAALLMAAVLQVQAQAPEYLYTTNGTTWTWRTDNFQPSAGGAFRIGSNDVIVTHLGYFDKDEDGLAEDHPVGIFAPPGAKTLLADVLVPMGTTAFYTNGFRWVQLAVPLTLKAGSNYVLAAQSPFMAGDQWPDLFTPIWNTNWLSGTSGTTRGGAYAWPYEAWPQEPTDINPGWANGKIYGCANIAYFPGGVIIGEHPQPATRYVTENVTFAIVAAGATEYQWYKGAVGSGTLLPGQTSASVTLSNLALADAGAYYCVAKNATSSATSTAAQLTVQAWTTPAFASSPGSQTAYLYQTVRFSGIATGSPVSSISYQWRKGSDNLPGQTNSTLTLSSVTADAAGTYTLVATNILGSASASATLTVITPAAGSYESAGVTAQPVLYYRFSELAFQTNIPNLGTAGASANGIARGTYIASTGPTPPAFPRFEAGNGAFGADGFSADAYVSGLNLNTNTVSMVAWVYPQPAQIPWSGIVYYRGQGGASGMFVKKDSLNNDILGYSWGGSYWNFNSDLVLTPYQWNFVALVIKPGEAVLYLNDGTGMKSTNQVAAMASVAFSGTTEIAWDNNGDQYDRRFYGDIDEVMIFNRSLSATEVYSLFAASSNYPPVIVSHPQSVTNSTGTPFTLTVGAFGTPPLAIQWYKQGSGAVAGGTAASYSVASATLTDTGTYFAVVTNLYGQATSDVATVTILQEAPQFTVLPQSVTGWLGESITLGATAIGSEPLGYQWFKNGAPLEGQTAASLTLMNLQVADQGNYVLRVTNSFGLTNSPAAALTVTDPLYTFQMLYDPTGWTAQRGDYQPIIGTSFRIGAADRRVTHLGYFDLDGDGLLASHHVGIYNRSIDNPGMGALLAEVLIPAGTSAVYSNGYRWVALSSPLILLANTDYAIASSTNNVDVWPEKFIPQWNSAFVGSTPPSTRYNMWDWPEVAWPHEPASWGNSPTADHNFTYGAYNLANFPAPAPVTITIIRDGANVQLSWPSGVLYQSDTLDGTYSAVPGATSPYSVTPAGNGKFYLLREQ